MNQVMVEIFGGYTLKKIIMSGLTILWLVLTTGCGLGMQPQHTTYQRTRSWVLKYSFPATIQSEPTGARVYIQDRYMGDTPLSTILTVNDLSIDQNGYTPLLCQWDLWLTNRNCEPEGDLEWKELSASFNGGWAIKIFKEGFQQVEFNLQRNSLKHLNNVVASLKVLPDDRLSTDELTSKEPEYFLFALKPTIVAIQTQPQYQQGTSSGNDLSAEYTAAKAEYESALQAYNVAKSKVDEAQMMNTVNRLPGSTGNPLFDLAVKGLASGEVQMQERNLEMAKERLERAKERLRILEMKR
jgi:hypothetical protein